ncbi:peptide maturation system acyl carrier-related protein [Clostridium sp. Marseille-Q2269]|uniref:peptide maturation system acyl carrier-related protein n=1 Tax=Clostridium sp. Marseille-Q2269 TaxID=2942205 RepID=UPI002072D0B5|nr:peptide maturation system acyl carrier-related protein [Clostridium sp. Marseille-Q2269]
MKSSILNRIFMRRTGIDFEENIHLKNICLLGEEIGVKPRDLVLILFDIEKEMGISISHDYINKGKFNTYENILKCVGK